MKSLADLLLKHRVPGARDAQIRHTIAEELTIILSIKILPTQIGYKDADVVLAVPPVVKSAVRLHTKAIVAALEERGIRISTIK